MSVTLHRWGNSVGLRVPKPLLEQLGLGEGSTVELRVENGRLIIEPERKRRLTMAELLEGITPDDRPELVDWGPPVGPRSLVVPYLPERGDLAWINFDPQAGREQAKNCPALVLTGSEFNAATGLLIVCPVTRTERPWRTRVPLVGTVTAGSVMIEQLKSIDWLARGAGVH